MKAVTSYNGVKWIHDYQDACVDKIDRFIRGDAAITSSTYGMMDRFLSGASSISGASSSVGYNRQNTYQRTISNDSTKAGSTSSDEAHTFSEGLLRDWQLATVPENEADDIVLFNLLSNNDNNSHEGINKKSSVNKQKTTTTTADCENENLIEEAAVLTTTTTSITNPISSKNVKLSNTNDDSSIPKPPPRGLKLSRKPPEKENTSKNDSKPGHSSGSSSSPEKLRSSPLFRKNVNKDLSSITTTTPTPTYPLAKSPARISKSSSRMRKQKMETLDTKKVLNKNKMKSHSMGSMIPTKLPSDTEEGAENLVTSCMQYLYENESYPGGGDFSTNQDKEEDLGILPKLINPFIDFQMHNNEDTTIGATAESRKLSTVSDIRDHITRNTPPSVMNYQQQRSDDSKIMYKTLPRAFQKNKKVVPKSVRNFLEKGQIVTQDLRAKSSEPPSSQAFSRQDGTESVSSFVMALSPKEDHFLELSRSTMETTSSEGWSDNDDYEDKTDSFNTRKGFVNKCVSRVKNLVGNNNNAGPT